jgi:hypothetical protein
MYRRESVVIQKGNVFVAMVMSGAAFLSGCGGGSGAADNQCGSGCANQTSTQGLAGVWSGTDAGTGLAINGIIDESGDFHFVRADGVQYVGTATATSDSISANIDGYSAVGQAFSDGSTSGSGSISGSLSLRTSMQLTDQFTTANGSSTSGSVSLAFNQWSYAGGTASLATVSGNYTDQSSGDVVSITSAGDVTWQDATTGCVGNGTISVTNPNNSVYQVQFSYENCQGQYASLNGGQFTGLAALNTSVNPVQVIVGVTGQAAGKPMYALSFTLDRT